MSEVIRCRISPNGGRAAAAILLYFWLGAMKTLTLILVAEFILAGAFIIKGEIANRRDVYRDYAGGKPFYVIGVGLLFAFVLTGAATLLTRLAW